ncbi:UNVERIFIED_CONTAM: hypothetical protein Sradi_1536000 [Sesamum radiatum]|uniref:Uncharacterized protein n=1 Tax=Sesamum radiatum TaxID=300843 RepID=A0AAW2U9U5_SESRA
MEIPLVAKVLRGRSSPSSPSSSESFALIKFVLRLIKTPTLGEPSLVPSKVALARVMAAAGPFGGVERESDRITTSSMSFKP